MGIIDCVYCIIGWIGFIIGMGIGRRWRNVVVLGQCRLWLCSGEKRIVRRQLVAVGTLSAVLLLVEGASHLWTKRVIGRGVKGIALRLIELGLLLLE